MRPSLVRRELAFQARFTLVRGALMFGEHQVGEVTGQLVWPIGAWYDPDPRPGQYLFSPPVRGQLPDEVLIETMGFLDAERLVPLIDLPEGWPQVPPELLQGVKLEAHLVFEEVTADEEYAANEPADIQEARMQLEGNWKLSIELPFEGSFRREETRVSLDRFEFEADARLASWEEE